MSKKEDDAFEIYFKDLSSRTQEQLLKFLRADNPRELNLDVFALCRIPKVDDKRTNHLLTKV